jgi:hypothetical protein
MIRTENIGRAVRRAEPPVTALWAARIKGRRDGFRGLPHVPPPAPLPPGAEVAVTGYIRQQRATAGRAAEQLRARLLDREWRLIADIRSQAVQVVTQYDVRGRPAPAALARFGRQVGEWRTKADVCRCRALAVHERINQQIACYWDAVRRHHRDVPDPAPAHLAHWAPARLELDPSWYRPDVWLSGSATPVSATARALEVLDTQGRPAAKGGR